MNSLTNHSTTQTADGIKDTISSGAVLGAKTGCLLSTLYSSLGFVVILALLSSNFGVMDAARLLTGLSLFLYILTLVPVLLLGAITGAILGWLSKILSGAVSKQRFLQVGILVCVLMLLVIHVASFAVSPLLIEEDLGYKSESTDAYFTEPLVPLTPVQSYLVFLGFPSIFYLVGGGWVSHRLSLKT